MPRYFQASRDHGEEYNPAEDEYMITLYVVDQQLNWERIDEGVKKKSKAYS